METSHAWGNKAYDTVRRTYLELLHNERRVQMRNAEPEEVPGAVFRKLLRKEYLEFEAPMSQFVDQQIDSLETITEVMDFMCDQGWNLWDTVEFLIHIIFPKLELDLSDDPGLSETGIFCFLLYKFGFVPCEMSFYGFAD
jgi:hypothetical protein